ncbi:MAG: cellulose biosynthesis cyclic di-GMP-binding regulatory protein BcsB, partial [Myxococcota bacterium]|nr:cellulose biosynthesis cyclic di-GMP-binding regulatory protein BcsB [Myxococcota bacterium]
MRPRAIRIHIIVLVAVAIALCAALAGAQETRRVDAEVPVPATAVSAGPAVSLSAPAGAVRQANGDFTIDLSFADHLRNGGDVSLVGIYAFGEIQFGIPDTWEVVGEPELHLAVRRSAQLIPEVSSVTVWVDGQPAGTFPLDGDPGDVDDEVLPLVLLNSSGYHTIQMVAYHRSLLPCEISD